MGFLTGLYGSHTVRKLEATFAPSRF